MANAVLDQLWREIDDNWYNLKELLTNRLPTQEYRMFADDGQWVECNRPMIESIVSDKVERSKRLFYYLCEIGVIQAPEAVSSIETQPDGRRVITINGYSGMGFTTGGQQRVERSPNGN